MAYNQKSFRSFLVFRVTLGMFSGRRAREAPGGLGERQPTEGKHTIGQKGELIHMLRTMFKGLAALAVVGLFAADANAGWWHHHRWGSCGSSGGWYGSWGSSGGSWGSSGGSWGSSGGWGYGSCGSSGGSWGSSGGSWGSSGGSYRPMTPAAPGGPAPATPMPSAPGSGTGMPAPTGEAAPAPSSSTYHPTYGPVRTSALLSVKVPTDAKVFVNDQSTTSTGSDREYISRDLARRRRLQLRRPR